MNYKTTYPNFNELVGEKITEVRIEEHYYDETIVFETESGSMYYLYHVQDCCESVSIEDIDNDLQKLVGTTVIEAELSYNHEDSSDGSQTWSFYKITNDNADHFTIRWYGESNGYYSETVTFKKYTPLEKTNEQ